MKQAKRGGRERAGTAYARAPSGGMEAPPPPAQRSEIIPVSSIPRHFLAPTEISQVGLQGRVVSRLATVLTELSLPAHAHGGTDARSSKPCRKGVSSSEGSPGGKNRAGTPLTSGLKGCEAPGKRTRLTGTVPQAEVQSEAGLRQLWGCGLQSCLMDRWGGLRSRTHHGSQGRWRRNTETSRLHLCRSLNGKEFPEYRKPIYFASIFPFMCASELHMRISV